MRSRQYSRYLCYVVVCAALLLAGCGGSTSAQSGTAGLTLPSSITQSGTITFGADFTEPPGTFRDSNHNMAGVDYELCTALGKQLGLKVQWVDQDFSGLIPALNAKRFDAICSSMFINPARTKVVDFVPYRETGQGAAVAAGNPHNVHDLSDVCGLHAAELLGSVYEKAIEAQSNACVAAGKQPIDLKTFNTVADAFTQLVDGRADIVMGDDPIVAYYVSKDPNAIQVAFNGKNPTLDGIGVTQQNSSLAGALTAALYELKANGTYDQILSKWHIANGEIGYF